MAKYKYRKYKGKSVRVYRGGWDGYASNGKRRRLVKGRIMVWGNYLKKLNKPKPEKPVKPIQEELEKSKWQVWVGGFLMQDLESGEFEYVKGAEWTQTEEPENTQVWEQLHDLYEGQFYKQYTKSKVTEMTKSNMVWGARLIDKNGAVLKEELW